MILKIGSRGSAVKTLQEFLGIFTDGVFGPNTAKAVKSWQGDNFLYIDGIVGPNTWKAMFVATTDSQEIEENVEFDDIISYLPRNEYIKGPYQKHWMFLHHTAGWQNPFNTVTNWANDSRGTIGTEFIIGGQSILDNNTKYDGTLVKCMPDNAMGWHLGTGNYPMHRESVAVEVCNFGQLTKGGYSKYVNHKRTWFPKKENAYYTYVGTEAETPQIVFLNEEFRGYKAWHKYSDKQIITLSELIKDVSERDNIDMRKGLPELIRSKGAQAAFDFCDVTYARNNPGLWTHANVLKTKVDMFPQQELIDMLLSIK